jgi:hypothetical protein
MTMTDANQNDALRPVTISPEKLNGLTRLPRMPRGRQELADVPWQIGGEEEPLAAVTVRPGERVGGLSVGRQATTLHFLHTAFPGTAIARWRRDVQRSIEDGTRRPAMLTLFRYVVHYEDGTSLEIPVRWGEGIESASRRTFEPVSRFLHDLPGARIAWQGDLVQATDERSVVYAMHWPNPRPDSTVQEIEVVGPDDPDAGPVQMYGITTGQGEPAGRVFYVAPDGDDAAEGSFQRPWATLNHAARTLEAGDTVYVRGGEYDIREPICPHNSGAEDRWITYAGYPGETPVLRGMHLRGARPDGKMTVNNGEDREILACRTGVFHVYDRSYIRVRGLTFEDSAYQGIGIDGFPFWDEDLPEELEGSHHVDILYNTVYRSGSTGIGSWGSLGAPVREVRIIGNRVLNAFDPGFTCTTADPGWQKHVAERIKRGRPFGDENLDVGHTFGFEVGHNEVAWGSKEGIDCKEGSREGEVHHNYIHDVFVIRSYGGGKAGIYLDTYFAEGRNLDVHHNVVQRTGTGIRVMTEGGQPMHHVRIHNNLCLENHWIGICVLSAPHSDHWVEHIEIFNNTVYRNGYLEGDHGASGGIQICRGRRLRHVTVCNNICVHNENYQIAQHKDIDRSGNDIRIDHNLCWPAEPAQPVAGWGKNVATLGDFPLVEHAQFILPEDWNFRLKRRSPAIDAGRAGSGEGDPGGVHPDLGAWPRQYKDDYDGRPHRSMHKN